MPANSDFPLKDEYTYQCGSGVAVPVNSQHVMRSPIPTPNKKVDTVVIEKSPLQQF
jgi:hypothetical protein